MIVTPEVKVELDRILQKTNGLADDYEKAVKYLQADLRDLPRLTIQREIIRELAYIIVDTSVLIAFASKHP